MTEDRLNEMYADVKVIKSDLKNHMKYIEEDVIPKSEDHEKRLRFLEKYAFLLIGGIGLFFFLVDLLKK